MAVQQQGNAGIVLQSVDRFARIALAALGAALLGAAAANASDFSEPWKRTDRALVIDAYEYNPIDWQKLAGDKRIVGFINKASDGLSPPYNCSGRRNRDSAVQGAVEAPRRGARTVPYAQDRRQGARPEMGRLSSRRGPGNPIEQANNFIDFAEPGPDDLIALDIEENDAEKWMSLEDAEIFVRHIKTRLGRWPVLYTNGSDRAPHRREPRPLQPAVAPAALVCALQAGDRPAFPEGQLADLYALAVFRRCELRCALLPLPGARHAARHRRQCRVDERRRIARRVAVRRAGRQDGRDCGGRKRAAADLAPRRPRRRRRGACSMRRSRKATTPIGRGAARQVEPLAEEQAAPTSRRPACRSNSPN